MNFLILLAQVYLGLVFFFFIKSARYVASGTFDFVHWKSENLSKVIWSMVGVTLLGLIYFIDPKALGFVLKFVGYDLEAGLQMTGVILGIIFGMATREIMKRKK